MPVWKWAQEKRFLDSDVTAKPGPYSLEVTPFMREPQDAFFDPAVQVTVLCCASRTGKTETEMNLTGYTIDHEPASVLWVYPTLEAAKKWRKQFLNPMLRGSPCFRGRVAATRSRDADNTLLSLRFPGGHLSAIGTNSATSFRQIQAARVICEEVDAMEDGDEGDPVILALKRADNYPESVQVISSTPTVAGRSRIWSWLQKSDLRKWFCPCRSCGTFQVWTWANMKWDDGAPETARLVCARCGAEHDEAQRRDSVRAGEWRPTQKFTGIRGYWLNGLNTLFPAKRGFVSSLHQMAQDFLTAKHGTREMIRTWTNTFLCEPFEEDPGVEIPPEELAKRGEDYAPDHLPVSVLLVTAGVDVQADRLEILFIGWGQDEEAWVIAKRMIEGDPETDEPWGKLDALLGQTFTRSDGLELGTERAFVDMQFKSKRVLAFCAPRISRGVFPCRGLNRAGINVPPLLPANPSRNNRARIPHWNVGVTVAKTAIFDRLALPVPGPRSIHFPEGHGIDPEHFRQLMAEKRRTRYQNGQAYFIFEKESAGVRNEGLDLTVYALAALESLGRIAWQKRAEYLRTLLPQPPAQGPADPGAPGQAPAPGQAGPQGEAAPPAPAPRPKVVMARRPWATSW